MNDDDRNDPEARLAARLHSLIQEHSDLGVAVEAIAQAPVPDMLVIARLKRKKLALKDEIPLAEFESATFCSASKRGNLGDDHHI